jgi:hypothetical protein
VCVGAIHFVKQDEVKSANTFGQAMELFDSIRFIETTNPLARL